jgi:glycosyltransferase involved in cell wall biosynthesis
MTLPRRILFITEALGIGGTESHLLDLLPELQERDFEVAVFCFTEKGTRAGRLETKGIPVYASPDLFGTGKKSLLTPLRLTSGAAKLFTLIRHFRPSIAHFFLPAPYIVGAPVAMAAGVPIKIMSRRSLNDYQRNWPGAAMAERILHSRMDALTGNAQAITRELVREGADETKVNLIYNGVRVPASIVTRQEARATLGIGEVAFVAVTVANLFAYKGHLDLINAFSHIADRLPRPWAVLLAGRDAGSRAEIEQLITATGLDHQFHLLGERNDVPQLLAAADVSVLAPTRNEGFSNAILESMTAGLPLVVTDIGGNAEAVVDNETGVVVPPHDVSALGAAILKLAKDPEGRRAMGERGRKRAAEEFSLSASVEKYCALYSELLERGGAKNAK